MKNTKKINKVESIEAVEKSVIDMDVVNADMEGEEKARITGFSPAPTSLLQAIERIDMTAEDSGLDKNELKGAEPEIQYLAKRVGISELQAILLSVVVNHGQDMSISNLTDRLSITTAQALSLLTEFKKLERLHLVEIEDHFRGICFSVPTNVLFRLSRNKDFKHERTTGLDSGEFLSFVHKIFCKVYDDNIDSEELGEEIQNLLGDNEKCNFVKALKKLRLSEPYQLVLLMMCSALYVDDRELIGLGLLRPCALNTVQYKRWRRELRTGTHDLMRKEFIEYGCENGIANTKTIALTKKAREKLLKDVEIATSDEQQPINGVIQSSKIKPKELYYDSEVAKQVDELARFFDQENYKSILERMEKSNFRSAFTCLFYGCPGTGKTETVNQLARITGRDIMLVDVPNLKDKWVGESEKNVKAVFDKYRALVKRSKVTPILLFNEADSIFGKRLTDVQHSVDQMLNTMQNIILQEMETLEGILIATTNLTENLDAAFERRFLYKVKFELPGVEAREHIWQTMISELTDEEVEKLANSYDFSGGQIENVARKFSINNILYGEDEESRLDSLFEFCDNELIQDSKSQTRRVGF
ncbi:MAG: ATP-binding protein [Muribaculaceae bacterium]|nr:ATP-binding protein [Muribaculaceae bacterium]